MEKLHPRAIWIFFFRFLGVGLFLVIFLGWFLGKAAEIITEGLPSLWWIFVFFLVWLGGSYLWAKLSYNAYKYQLTEDAFKKEQGVIWKKYVSVPYERIQNVDIHRGILARILGLSDLMIQTAGYSGGYGRRGIGHEPEGRLPGVSRERAEQLREELIQRSKGTKSGV